MRNLRLASAAMWIAVVAAALLAASPRAVMAQTPAADPPGSVPRFIKVVEVDACNACVQMHGCDQKTAKCTDGCNSTYPPNDPRGAKCLAACSRPQNRCVREAQKSCQACK
jgi:hypothetical protein